jgi:hypothetical protein
VPSGRPWTEELFTAVEGALTRREPGALLQDVVRDNFPGAVDSASRLLRLCVTTDTAPKAVELADRIWSMWTAYTGNLDIGPRITYGGFIAQSAFSTAHRLHNFAPAEARKLGQRACDWTIAVRDILPATLEGKVADTWKVAEAALPKRYELLGFCSTDVQALEAYVLGLVNLPQVQLDSIRKADSPSLSANFADCEDATRLLKRVGNVVEKEVQGDIAAIVIAAIETRHFDTFLRGTLVEKIMDAIEFAQFRTDVQAAIVALCDYALGIYAKTYPVRRMRVLVRLMHLAVSTGAAGAVNRLPALADEVNALSSPEADLGADAPLAPARAEYAASALILTALSKYHAEAEPAALVARFGGEALALVRAATAPTKVLPAATGARVAAKRTAGTATRERVTRAPARTAAKPATTTIARRGTVKTEAKREFVLSRGYN